MKTYEINGKRVTFPESWDEEKCQAWIKKATGDLVLRRNLRMIKKDGSTQLLNAHRMHGKRH